MIKLENYDLKKLNVNDKYDMIFFESMLEDEKFKEYFGKIYPCKSDQNSTFMNDYIIKKNNNDIGYVHIASKITKGDINAVTLYYYIDKLYRKNGIATNVLKELMEYLHKNENINYIILNIHKTNTSSIHVAINNGFIKNLVDEEEIQFIHKTL